MSPQSGRKAGMGNGFFMEMIGTETEKRGRTATRKRDAHRRSADEENADQSAQGLIRRKAAWERAKAEPPVARTANSQPNHAVAHSAHRTGGPVRAERPTGGQPDKADRRTRTDRARELSIHRWRAYRPRFRPFHSHLSNQAWPRNHPRTSRRRTPRLPRRNAPSRAAIRPAATDLAMEANDALVGARLRFPILRQAGPAGVTPRHPQPNTRPT